MAISMSERLRTHNFIEMCKTEALSTSLKILEVFGQSMTDARKEFIIDRVSKYIDQYKLDTTYALNSYSLVRPDQPPEDSAEQVEDFFVKTSEIVDIFSELQGRMVGMLVGLVVSELTTFLLMEDKSCV